LQEAAYYYTRYHALAPDDLLGIKKLAEVCTALEDPSTGPFGEAQDRLRTGAGVEDESCRQATERVIRNSQFAICTRRWRPAPMRGAGGPHR